MRSLPWHISKNIIFLQSKADLAEFYQLTGPGTYSSPGCIYFLMIPQLVMKKNLWCFFLLSVHLELPCSFLRSAESVSTWYFPSSVKNLKEWRSRNVVWETVIETWAGQGVCQTYLWQGIGNTTDNMSKHKLG